MGAEVKSERSPAPDFAEPVVLYARKSGGGLVKLELDPSTHTLTTTTNQHHEIHNGSSWTTFLSGTGKNDGDTTVIAFRTPDIAARLHLTFLATSTGGAHFFIMENVNVTVNTGATLVVCNDRRDIGDVTQVYDFKAQAAGNATSDPTQSGGTKIYEEYIGSGLQSGGKSGRREERVLQPNQDYAFVIESDTATNILNLVLSWYMHTDK